MNDPLKREKALYDFWSGFGLPVYDETSVPDEADSYRMIGEKTLYSEKPATIGVGDKPERIRTIMSTGKIMKDGLIVRNKNKIKKVVVSKRKSKVR